MAGWLIPALKLVLPHVGTIITAARPVFTGRKPGTGDTVQVLQQQVAELQTAVSQNTDHIRELAAQLQKTVAALEEAAEAAQGRLNRALLFCLGAGLLSIVSLGVSIVALAR
jgi:hypothetical protein